MYYLESRISGRQVFQSWSKSIHLVYTYTRTYVYVQICIYIYICICILVDFQLNIYSVCLYALINPIAVRIGLAPNLGFSAESIFLDVGKLPRPQQLSRFASIPSSIPFVLGKDDKAAVGGV